MREKWTARTWTFDIPPGRMHMLLARLRGTAARIADAVRDVSPDALRRRSGETWSAQENIGHLWAIEALHLGRMDDYEQARPVLRAADMTNRATWDANYNDASIDPVLAGFRAERRRLVERLEAWDPDRLEHSALHPRLQMPMRVIDLAYFTAEHDDYHLARVHELLSTFAR